MNAIDYIKMSLKNGKGWAMGLISDMKDSPMTQPTPNGGNHPLWVLGHIVRAESDLLDGFILGQPNRFPELECFSMGQTPSTNASDYPSMGCLESSRRSARRRWPTLILSAIQTSIIHRTLRKNSVLCSRRSARASRRWRRT
jgi:hypothetical protein